MVDGLEFPTGIAFSPDGKSMYVNERPGRIRVVERGELLESPLATIPTTTDGETGLLGMDLSSDGSSLFVFATDPGGSVNNVLRVSTETGESEVIVPVLPASLYHNGGGVAVDADGNVLISNGEKHEDSIAQDPSVLGGKIYRFTPDGDDVPDNPYGSAIALGLRNPFGMTIDPVTGDAFVTENGPSSHDEINRIQTGGNYGWPDVLGVAGDVRPPGPGEYHDPVSVQEEIVVPTGIAIADPDDAPEDLAGDVFYGTYGERSIHRIELNEERDSAVVDEIFLREDDPIVALEWGPGGLYYSTTSAIKLVRMADSARGPDRGNEEETAGGPEATGPPLSPDPSSENPWPLIVAGLGIIFVGAAVVVIGRRR